MMPAIQRLHMFLSLQSALVLIAATDRFIPFTAGLATGNDFWPLLNLSLVYDLLPLVAMIVVYGLKKAVDGDAPRGWIKDLPLNLVFMAGMALLLWSYEIFDRWIFLSGLAVSGVAVMLLQAKYPYKGELTRRDTVLFALEGVLLAAGLAANTWADASAAVAYALATLALLASGLLWSHQRAGRGWQPVFVYYAIGCWLGLVGSLAGQVTGKT
jgi:hypothetical protein